VNRRYRTLISRTIDNFFNFIAFIFLFLNLCSIVVTDSRNWQHLQRISRERENIRTRFDRLDSRFKESDEDLVPRLVDCISRDIVDAARLRRLRRRRRTPDVRRSYVLRLSLLSLLRNWSARA